MSDPGLRTPENPMAVTGGVFVYTSKEAVRTHVVAVDVPFRNVLDLVFKVWIANLMMGFVIVPLFTCMGGGGLTALLSSLAQVQSPPS